MGRLWFNRRGRIALYSLGAAAALVVAISIFLGARALLEPGQSAERKPAATTQEQGSLKTREPTTPEEAAREPAEKEKTEAARRVAAEEVARKQAKEKAAEEEAAQRVAREEAERQALINAQLEAEQAAAEQYAAEWTAIQEIRQREAAAEQAAIVEQQAQEKREEQRVARQQQTTEQAALGQAYDPASLFPQAMAAPSSTTFSLTIPKLDLYAIPVVDDTSEVGLSQGAGHLPGTGFPWIAGSNIYIAGHRLGYAGTPSDHVFYNLPSLVMR